MTTRQVKGISLGITGLLGMVAGIVLLATSVTPDWLGTAIGIVGIVLNALGFRVVVPNTEE